MSIYETTSQWLDRQHREATAYAWMVERDPDGIAGPDEEDEDDLPT
jgi:hypothetical protein